MRKKNAMPDLGSVKTRFSLQPVPPFNLEVTAWALRRDPRNEIDRWNDGVYRRTLRIDGAAVPVAVRQPGGMRDPRLLVEVAAPPAVRSAKKKATAALDDMLGLSLDLSAFYRFARGHPRLNHLAQQFKGLKPPRFPSVWEALVNAISCQQISLAVGITLMNRLARQCSPSSLTAFPPFPQPEDLANTPFADLRAVGYSFQKAAAITELARAIVSGQVKLEAINHLDDQQAVDFLMNLKGIGPWSAQYVLLRGLRRVNIVPANDVGFQDKLSAWLHSPRPLGHDGVTRAIQPLRPYGGFLFFFMLLNHLREEGVMAA
jgi:DNA-3-methyladenine glycosylase II